MQGSIIGTLFGLLSGAIAWLAARAFVAHHRDEAVDLAWLLEDARGALTPLGALFVAALALLGAFIGGRAAGTAEVVVALLASALYAAITVIDFRVRRIPNPLVVALLAVGALQMLWLGRPTLASAALGLLVGGGIFVLLALLRRGAMGAGDVKLAAAVGWLVGFPLALTALFWGIIAGGVAALVLLITRRAGRKDTMAYGPYLSLGGWLLHLAMLGLLPWGA
ncbi:MAG TPA: prepilin peptidase [Chloroflexi bacterium]|nr:prepilin peptidase [Chloroflexota bacterium]